MNENDNVKDGEKNVNNLFIWDKLKSPPDQAVKKITGGRLKGMSDIKPQWRYKAMTEQFGLCGIGWKYTIDKLWTENGSDEQILVFAQISLFVSNPYKIELSNVNIESVNWSNPIPGVGGSMMISKESGNRLHNSDECFKMAITDALGTAMKMIGVAAEIYQGYSDSKNSPDAKVQQPEPRPKTKGDFETAVKELNKDDLKSLGLTAKKLNETFEWTEEEKDRLRIKYLEVRDNISGKDNG